MKILFCSPHKLDVALGAPKVVIELASEMRELGWTCDLVSDEEVCPSINQYIGFKRGLVYADYLKEFLQKNAKNYQVVDYDQSCLPFSRHLFPPSTLFVARSVLLVEHFEKIFIPPMPGIKSLVMSWLRAPKVRSQVHKAAQAGDLTCKEADLVNVSNTHDKAELIRRGVNQGKIHVLPFGLTEKRFAEFSQCKPGVPSSANPIVAFVGTFDGRKGARDIPKIVGKVATQFSNVKFRIMGARYKSTSEILSYFPKRNHRNLDIITHFEPEELPGHLKDCSIGIFPSYLEGFGFGVLEMLAACLPVIAYRSPGPPMMLTDEMLVEPGDASEMSRRILYFLQNPVSLQNARVWAKTRALDFKWKDIARHTSEIYSRYIEDKPIL